MRRKLVTIGSFNMFTGESSKEKKQEWREEECGTPIFGNNSQHRKVCDSCLNGWTHENNYILNTEANKKLLEQKSKK